MTRITLPPEAFYWAIVDGVGLRHPGPLPPGLLTLAADDIPVNIDTLHAVGTVSEQGSIVVCALERTQLEALEPDVVSLTPSAAPPGIDVALSQLELLVDQFEPRSMRRRRTRRHVSLAIVVLLCSALITTGLTRRTSRDLSTAASLADARTKLLAQADIDPRELARRIKQTQALAASRASAPRDITPTLAAMLRNWPDMSEATVESMSLSEARVLASVSMDSDPGTFLEAFEAPSGWRLEQPRLSSVRGLTRMALELSREPPE